MMSTSTILLSAGWSILYLAFVSLCILGVLRCLVCLSIFYLRLFLACLFSILIIYYLFSLLPGLPLSSSPPLSLFLRSFLVFLDVYYDGLIFNYWKQLPSCLSESPASYYPTLSSTSPSFSSLPSLPTSPSPSFPPRLLPLLLCWHRQQSNFN